MSKVLTQAQTIKIINILDELDQNDHALDFVVDAVAYYDPDVEIVAKKLHACLNQKVIKYMNLHAELQKTVCGVVV